MDVVGVTITEFLGPARRKRSGDEGVAVESEPAALIPEDGPSGRSARFLNWTTGIRWSLSRPTSLVVLASMVVGTVIRLDVPRGLWLDEAVSVSEARMPYGAMIHRLATTDVHPPLYFTILWATIRLIGDGDYAVRVPSILFGIVLIPLVYLLGKEAYDRRTGAVASVIVSVAPIVVWYSQEARMYMMLMVFGVVALWAQLRILRRGGWYPWVVYTVASIAMVWTQYFGMWQLLLQQLVFVGIIVVMWWRDHRIPALLPPWLCSVVPIALTSIPLALLMKEQFGIHQATGQAFGPAANAVVGTGTLSIYSIITNFVYGVSGYHSAAVVSDVSSFWPFGMLAGLALLGRRVKPVTYLLFAAVLVPVTAMFLVGHFKTSLFDIRYMSTAVPVLLLLIARTATVVATSKRVVTIVIVAVVAMMLVALFDQQFSSANPYRFNFREALQRVDAHARPGDIILYDPVNSQLNTLTTYYSPKVKSAPLTAKPTIKSGQTIFVVTSKILMTGADESIMYSAESSLGDRVKHPQHWVFPNVQVWVYHS